MPYCYKPLWEMLAKHGMNKTQFRETVGLSTSTLAKLSANKPVSSEVLAKICDYFCCGLNSVATYASETELFMISLEPDIIGWKYILHIDGWPEYCFDLTDTQIAFLNLVGRSEFKKVITQCEQIANEKYFPNAGIIGSTTYSLTGNKLWIEGSFGVIEYLLPWIIEHAKIQESM